MSLMRIDDIEAAFVAVGIDPVDLLTGEGSASRRTSIAILMNEIETKMICTAWFIQC